MSKSLLLQLASVLRSKSELYVAGLSTARGDGEIKSDTSSYYTCTCIQAIGEVPNGTAVQQWKRTHCINMYTVPVSMYTIAVNMYMNSVHVYKYMYMYKGGGGGGGGGCGSLDLLW